MVQLRATRRSFRGAVIPVLSLLFLLAATRCTHCQDLVSRGYGLVS